jgi:hypothetical protein
MTQFTKPVTNSLVSKPFVNDLVFNSLVNSVMSEPFMNETIEKQLVDQWWCT